MKWAPILTGAAMFLTSQIGFSSPAVRFEIQPDSPGLMTPISLNLEGLGCLGEEEQFVLTRIEGEKKVPVTCQVEPGHTSRLWFVPDKPLSPGQKSLFELTVTQKDPKAQPSHRIVKDDKVLTLQYQDRDVISYYHAVHPVPQGVDSAYQRSGFLHPLWSPDGKVLTQIQPADHYHHYGIWNPWTRTHVEGREVDFWNLAQKQGTVRFAGLVSTTSGPVFSGFKARQEHVVFLPEGKEKTAILELLEVRSSSCRVDGQQVWVIDFTSELENVLDSTIVLNEYRYGGGIGFRATEQWNNDNSSVLTSEGKTRSDADGTRARWCDLRGATGDNHVSGVLFLSHCGNRQHPEPMRVWPPDMNGRGDVFFEFCPIRLADWNLEPGQEYVLRYRMVVYDGTLKPQTAEVLWKNFVNPPLGVPLR